MPSGREMTDDDLELARCPLPRRPPERRRHRRGRRARRARSSATRCCCCSTRTRTRCRSRCRRRRPSERWETLIDTADPVAAVAAAARRRPLSAAGTIDGRAAARTAARKTCGGRRTGGRWGCTDACTASRGASRDAASACTRRRGERWPRHASGRSRRSRSGRRRSATAGSPQLQRRVDRRRACIPRWTPGGFRSSGRSGEDVIVGARTSSPTATTPLAAALLYRQRGGAAWHEVPMAPLGNDRWQARFHGRASWAATSTRSKAGSTASAAGGTSCRKKSAPAQDVTSELLEGAALVRDTLQRVPERGERGARRARQDRRGAGRRNDRTGGSGWRRRWPSRCRRRWPLHADRSQATRYRPRAATSRSSASGRGSARGTRCSRARPGPIPNKSGTFRDAEALLPYVASMGFDVLYLPPIHPIGRSFRKGRNNTLDAGPDDPGSPWAIGGEAGGHTAVEPGLGTSTTSIASSRRRGGSGLEIALDIAFQASPDHPWVQRAPGVVPSSARRHDQVRREPAEEVPGHLPVRLRVAPTGRRCGTS